MIKNRHEFSMFMDFSKMNYGRGQPSDIDMFFIGKDNTLVLGEIKNELGTFGEAQRKRLQLIADNYKYNAVIIYITHDKRVELGDSEVDISQCKVQEIYYKKEKKWRIPKYNVTAGEIVSYYS